MPTKTATKPSNSAPVPGEERSFEVWMLVGPLNAPMYWLRTYPKPRTGEPMAQRAYDKGRNFSLAEGLKIKKRWRKPGDLIVNDTSGNADVAHYVPQDVLGRNGKIFLRSRAEDGDLVWLPLVTQSSAANASNRNAIGPGTAKKRDHAFKWLDEVRGDQGNIIAARPLIDPETWTEIKSGSKSISDFATSYTYTLIRGMAPTDMLPVDHKWLMVEKDGNEDTETAYKAKRMQHLLEGDYTEYDLKLSDYENDLEDYIKEFHEAAIELKKAKKGRNVVELFGRVKTLAGQILEEAVPSATPGSTAPLDYLNTLMSEGAIPKEKIVELTNGFTKAGVENAGTLIAVIVDIHKITQLSSDKESDRGEMKTTVADLMDHLAKLGAGTVGVAETLAKLIHGVSNVPPGLDGTISSVVGPVIGFANAARNGRKAHHSGKRYIRLVSLRIVVNTLSAKVPSDTKNDAAREGYAELDRCLGYIIGKMGRRTAKQWTTVAAGVVGTTGATVGTIIAATALANIWNPVGWTLLAGGAALGLAVVGWSTWRHFTKKSRRAKRGDKGKPKRVDEFTDRIIAIMSLRGVHQQQKDSLYQEQSMYLNEHKRLVEELRQADEQSQLYPTNQAKKTLARQKFDALEALKDGLDYRITQRELARDILGIFNVPLSDTGNRYALYDKHNGNWNLSAPAIRRSKRILKRHAKK